MDTTMQIVIKAIDEASATVGKITGSLKTMEPVFKTMAAGGVAAFASISAVGIKSIKDFADAEKASAMLEHAVIGVTHATEAQLKATSDLADALEKKGVLDGDNIKVGLAQLSTFGLSNKAVQALGGSLADLAVNQFGVSASGDQLSDTANTIAKALNGQFGVLEKSGIRFTEAQKHTIEFGTEMQKVDAINKGFAQNLKFTNEVALSTTEGQMAKAAVSAGNLSEALGGTLKPIVEQLSSVIVPFLDKVRTWIEANPELTKKIVIATAAVAGIVAVIGTLGLVLPAVIAGFSALAAISPLVGASISLMLGPIGLVILAIGALVAAGVFLYKNWDEVSAKALSVWETITTFIGEKLNTTKQFIEDVWNGIKDFFSTVFEAIKTIFTFQFVLMLGIVTAFLDKFDPAWKEHLGAAVELVKEALTFISNAFSDFGAWFGKMWKDFWGGAKDTYEKVINFFAPALNGTFTAISEVLASVGEPLMAAWGSLWEGIKAVFVSVTDVVKSVFVGVINFIIEQINRGIEMINTVAKKGGAAVGISAPQIPTIPALASGGIVNSPTLALIGEAGPEAVVPLNGSNGIGGNNVSISIGNFFGGDAERAARKLGDLMISRLQLNTR